MCILWELLSEWIDPETFERALQFAGVLLALLAICLPGLLAARAEIRIWRPIRLDRARRREQHSITNGRTRLR